MAQRQGRAHLDEVYADDVMDILGVDHYHTGFFGPGSDGTDLREATVRYLEELFAHVRLDPTSRVIDVGCGPGSTARWLAARTGAWALGIDIVGQQLRFAQRSSRAATGPATFAQMDAGVLAVGSGSFDAVVAVESLCHLPDKPTALAELHRVLRPGGSVLISDFVLAPGASRLARRTVQSVVESDCLASAADYQRWLTDAGFTVHAVRDVSVDAAVGTADAVLQRANRARMHAYLRHYLGPVKGRAAAALLPALRLSWNRAFRSGAAGLVFVHATR
jgi:cyclopropane fatty-acyl-phospholipid synthase-like methyltransferase